MSTKTTIKRISLVAVSALGLGVLTSVAPATAAEHPAASVTTGSIVKTLPSGRTGVGVKLTSTITIASIAGDETGTTVRYASAFAGVPAGSALTSPTLAVTESSSNLSVSSPVLTIGADISASETATATVTFTPDKVGTYSVVIWHDRDADGTISTGESAKTVDVVVVDGASAVKGAVSIVNSTTSTNATGNGSLVKFSIKNSSDAAASLGALETLTATTSGSAVIYKINGSTTNANASSVVLNRDMFDKNGNVWLNITDGTAESSVLTIAGNTGAALAGITLTSTIKFVDETTTGTVGPLTFSNTTGVKATTAVSASADGTWTTKTDSSTAVAIKGTSSAVSLVHQFTVTDTSGILTGYVGGVYDLVATTEDAATAVVTFTLTAALAAGESYTVAWSETGAGGGDLLTVQAAAAASTTGTVDQATSLKVKTGTSTTLSVVVKDQYGLAFPNAAVAVSVTGRNASTSNTNLVTDASGRVSFTLADAPAAGVTSVQDVVTFDIPAGTDPTVTLNYVTTLGVSKIVVTTPNTTAGVANETTTITDIAAGAAGAQASTTSVTAKVTDASGSVLVGVPVTFSISGTGAAVLSTKVTAYTDATGVATSSVYGWVAGAYTVTATAEAVSGTGSISFGQTTATEARSISATTSGSIVTATVKDRFGNGVKGATVYATKTGAGYFGSGVSSTSGTTDASGNVEFNLAGGAVTVTVSLVDPTSAAGTTFGQSAAAKGYDIDATNGTALTAYVAGTAVKAETGVGSSFDAAGVSSASVDVAVSAASDAIDAANEATDAANAATDAANAAAEAADAATAAAQDAQAAVAALATSVASLIAGIKAQITTLTNLVIKIQKKVKA